MPSNNQIKQMRERAADLRGQADRLDDRADKLDSRPKDYFLEGAVIVFTKQGRYGTGHWSDYQGPLKYAAIKAGNRDACWFLTGLTQYAKTWDELLDFIGEENLHTVRSSGWIHMNSDPDHTPGPFKQYGL